MPTTPTPYDEKTLLGSLAKGEAVAFTELYLHYHPLIYAYGLKFLKLESLAEDLVHEVFLQIWEMRGRLAVHTSFRAYLYRATRNRALNMLDRVAADRSLREQVVRELERGL